MREFTEEHRKKIGEARKKWFAEHPKEKEKLPKKEIAAKVGELIAHNAKEAGVQKVAFDRNGYLYHGRIKELADAARKGGLKF